MGIIEGTATAGEAFEKGVSNEVIEVVDETHSAELNNIPKANSSTTESDQNFYFKVRPYRKFVRVRGAF